MPLVSEGYVYVSNEDVGVMAHATAGAKISLHERRPPWIVVDHSINSIVVAMAREALRVAITDAVGIEQASTRTRYTRAFEVRVVEEISPSRLFGERGDAVCTVIAGAGLLELAQIHLLAQTRHPDAAEAYSRAWNDWLAAVGGTDAHRGENLHGTLAISGGGCRSPINCGLTVLYQTISDRAEKLVGSTAFILNEDGDKYFEPTWAAASLALLETAMAFGAPLVSETDRQIMSAAWYSVIHEHP